MGILAFYWLFPPFHDATGDTEREKMMAFWEQEKGF
jgi:hypothetical protein